MGNKIQLAKTTDNIEEIKKLSVDEQYSIRIAVAQNQNTPISVLEKLADDEDEDVRYFVAQNINTPNHILEKLSNDKKWRVRYVVAQNLNTTSEVLEKLALEEDDEVRYAVAQNINTPNHILEKLFEDENTLVRNTALQTLNSRNNDTKLSGRTIFSKNKYNNWDEWLDEQEKKLKNYGFRKYIQNLKNESFLYSKTYSHEGIEYQIILFFYDYRNIQPLNTLYYQIGFDYEINLICEKRIDLTLSADYTMYEIEEMAKHFINQFKDFI